MCICVCVYKCCWVVVISVLFISHHFLFLFHIKNKRYKSFIILHHTPPHAIVVFLATAMTTTYGREESEQLILNTM
jgi:hypothetical protein